MSSKHLDGSFEQILGSNEHFLHRNGAYPPPLVRKLQFTNIIALSTRILDGLQRIIGIAHEYWAFDHDFGREFRVYALYHEEEQVVHFLEHGRVDAL